MVNLTPVDDDPFGQPEAMPTAPTSNLTPVDHDPFDKETPEQSSGLTHQLARTGRDIVGGLAGIGDVGYAAVPPIYHGIRSGLKAAGVDVGSPQDTSKMMPSLAATAVYDRLTNNAGVPQSAGEAVFDKAGQFLTGAAAGAPLAKMATQAPELAAIAPQATSTLSNIANGVKNAANTPIGASEALSASAVNTPIEALSVMAAGAGSEKAHQMFPESNIAPALGAIAGGASVPAAGMAFNAAQKAVAPAASEIVKPIAQKALNYGIPLSRSQIGDSKFNQGLASVSEKMPLSGGAKFRETQQTAFNKAVASTFGEDADKITPDVINNAYKNIGKKFDEVHSGLQVKVGDDILNQLGAIEDDAKHSITNEHFKIVKNNIDKFLRDIDKNGVIPGEKLNSLRSNLAKTLKTTRNDSSSYLGDIHDLIMDTATARNPESQAILQEARSQYRNLKTIEPLAAKAERGNISPALLTNQVRQGYRDFTRGGGGKLGDLARIGNTFLKEKIPNSGTPERQMIIKSLEGAGAIGAGIAAPSIVLPAASTLGLAKGFNMFNQSQAGVRGALGRPAIVNAPNFKPGLMSAALKH